MTTALLTGALLVYDGDCAFCSTSVRWLEDRFPDSFAAQQRAHGAGSLLAGGSG